MTKLSRRGRRSQCLHTRRSLTCSPARHIRPPTRGHTLGAPRFYDAFADMFFFGRRRRDLSSPAWRRWRAAWPAGPGCRLRHGLLRAAARPGGWFRRPGRRHRCLSGDGQLRPPAGCRYPELPVPDRHGRIAEPAVRALRCRGIQPLLHHLPADLRVPALREMRRVLRPGGTLLVVDAHIPRAGRWHLLAAITGHRPYGRRWFLTSSHWWPRQSSRRSAPAMLRPGCATCTRSRVPPGR